MENEAAPKNGPADYFACMEPKFTNTQGGYRLNDLVLRKHFGEESFQMIEDKIYVTLKACTHCVFGTVRDGKAMPEPFPINKRRYKTIPIFETNFRMSVKDTDFMIVFKEDRPAFVIFFFTRHKVWHSTGLTMFSNAAALCTSFNVTKTGEKYDIKFDRQKFFDALKTHGAYSQPELQAAESMLRLAGDGR